MPVTRPTELPRWSEDTAGAETSGAITTPNAARQTMGFVKERLAYDYLNWLHNRTYKALRWLFDVFGEQSPGGTLTVSRSVTVSGSMDVGANITGGDISGENLSSSGDLSVAGAASIGEGLTTNTVTATGQISGGSLITTGPLGVGGAANVNSLSSATTVSASTSLLSPKVDGAVSRLSIGTDISTTDIALGKPGAPTVVDGSTVTIGHSGGSTTVNGPFTASGASSIGQTGQSTVVKGNVTFPDGVAGNITITAAPPSTSSGVKNTLTTDNMIKAKATITTNGIGVITITGQFNIDTVGTVIESGALKVKFIEPMANANYTVTVTPSIDDGLAGPWVAYWKSKASGTVNVEAYQVLPSTGLSRISFTGTALRFDISVTGAQ
jgi:hypothetical protein